MSKIKDIQSFIGKANVIQQSVTGKYRVLQDAIVSGKARIDKTNLPDDVWSMMHATFAKRLQRELMHFARDQRGQYHAAAAQAKKLAGEVIRKAAPKPDQVAVDEFERKLSDLRTEITLSTAKKGNELLSAFVDSIRDPYFAGRVRTEMRELVAPILLSADSQDAPRFKLELQRVFSDVKDRTLTPEAREAVGLLETSEAILQSDLFGYAVKGAAAEHLGPRVADYINSPEEWFRMNPDAEAVTAGQLTDDERTVESVLAFQARAAVMPPVSSLPKPGGILPPSPYDNE